MLNPRSDITNETEASIMNMPFGRLARALLLTGGIATALALPSLVGAPLMPSNAGQTARVALAAPAADNDSNGIETADSNDDSDERNIEGQVLELHSDTNPPEVLIGTLGENVWARIYNDQLNRSGIEVGDYVHLQGEFGEHNIFDAYQVNVDSKYGDNGNDND
jgi:hypothetical protein